jgi:hypothetical protein
MLAWMRCVIFGLWSQQKFTAGSTTGSAFTAEITAGCVFKAESTIGFK